MNGARSVAWLAALAVIVLPFAGEAAGTVDAAARVSLTVRLGAAGTGTFRMAGDHSDTGRVAARRSVARRTLRTTETLTSTKGTLVISTAQACARTKGTWRIVSGTRGYAGATGSGTTSGRIGCTRPFKPTTVLHTGSLTVPPPPPPPLATVGTYRGWTTQDREVSFEVTPDGRSLVNFLFGGYGADCEQQQGLRRVEWSGVDIKVAGPVTIAEDRTFSLDLSRAAKVTGRFAESGASGTISIAYEWDAGGHFWKCAANVPWTVSTPAPPPWQAVAGKYCGITPQGEGVCLDVPAGGRELRNVNAGIPLVCGETGFLVRLTIEGPFPLRSDLSFQASFTQPLGDDGSARVFLNGSFDRSGTMTGRITLQQPAFTYQGTRYTCRNGGAAWTAKLQS